MSYWKNILKLKGTIDPTTIEIAKKAVALEEKIEFHLRNMLISIPNSPTYNTGKELIEKYAREYKILTGDWYRRDWKENKEK